MKKSASRFFVTLLMFCIPLLLGGGLTSCSGGSSGGEDSSSASPPPAKGSDGSLPGNLNFAWNMEGADNLARLIVTNGLETDGSAPSISITSPTANPTHDNGATSLLTLSGVASDNSAVKSVTWSNSRGGSGTARGTSSWEISFVTLSPGSNVITVTASDGVNTSTDSITVTWTPGTIYYVTQNGAGSGNGSSLANAASLAAHNSSSFSPDSVIYLCGTFTLNSSVTTIKPPSSGTPGHNIVYRGDYPGYPCVINATNVGGLSFCMDGGTASYITVTGVTGYGAVHSGILARSGETGWMVDHCTMYSITGQATYGHGILIMASNSTVQYSTTYDCLAHGIYVLANGTTCANVGVLDNNVYNNRHTNIDIRLLNSGSLTNVKVLRNKVYATSDWTAGNTGIYTNGVAAGVVMGLYIAGNEIWTNTGRGCHIDPYVTDVAIYNNSFLNGDMEDLYINNGSGAVTVINNIIRNDGGMIRIIDPTNKTIDYNNWYCTTNASFASVGGTYYTSLAAWNSGTGFDTHSIAANPMFASLAVDAYNFQLQDGSPCIDAGYDLNSAYAVGMNKTSQVSPWDMGANVFVRNDVSGSGGATTLNGFVAAGGDASATLTSQAAFSTSVFKDGAASLSCPTASDGAVFNSAGVITSSQGTVEEWVYIDTWDAAGAYLFVYQLDADNCLRLLATGSSATDIEFQVYYDAGSSASTTLTTSKVNGVQDGWYKVVLKWKQTGDPNLGLWVYNSANELVDSVTGNVDLIPFASEGATFTIGNWGSTGADMPLFVDGVRIWSTWQN